MATESKPMILTQLDVVFHASNDNRVKHEELTLFDKGLFLAELKRQKIPLTEAGQTQDDPKSKGALSYGTYNGTKLALLELFKLYEESSVAKYDTRGYEPSFPVERSLDDKRELYKWSNPAEDFYPPHLKQVPEDQQHNNIFNKNKLGEVNVIAGATNYIIPDDIKHFGTPYFGPSLADTEAYNRDPSHKRPMTDIMDGKNMGDLADWYSDRRFGDQQLSGVNPCTIEAASMARIQEFAAEAGKQGLKEMEALINKKEDLYMQDYSFFRTAMVPGPDNTFVNNVPIRDAQGQPALVQRYASAPIGLFQLDGDGVLHPLAITLDYKGTMDESVTIFNKRLRPADKAGKAEKDIVAEKDDWPWRYAKTVHQVADWGRHEVGVHLTDTHLIEEALIVATNRTVPDNHIIYELLSPHWFRTLALNKGARDLLVPVVIDRIAGFGPKWRPPIDAQGKPTSPADSNAYRLVRYAFENFDFQGKYIPNDLKARGFDVEKDYDTGKLRNYPYAPNMFMLWKVLRAFVERILNARYKSDESVRNDKVIANWCKEIQDEATIKTFPTIETRDQLIDACTMCIHIASPQHTAINYTQSYYYSYVPSKPPALCSPIPTTLEALDAITEQDLTNALPIGIENVRWKDWLLASQLPELLSFRVEDKYNLLTYAHTLYAINARRSPEEVLEFKSVSLAAAGAELYGRLLALQGFFEANSAFQSARCIPYKVMNPSTTAVSILI